ncbi:WHG domain-containing protein, partial [bacterium]|nr:WHG domain-containing protein [bacterium]
AYFNFARQHPGFYDALMYYEMKDHDTVKPLSEAHQCRMQGDDSMNILIQTIELGIQDGSLRPDLNIEQTAMFLWAASMGMVQLLTTKGKHLEECHGIPMKQMENITFDLIKKAIGATS